MSLTKFLLSAVIMAFAIVVFHMLGVVWWHAAIVLCVYNLIVNTIREEID